MRLFGTTSDSDTYRTAARLPEQHGDTAPICAAMEANRLPVAGGLDGAATWRRILDAVKQMQGVTPACRRSHETGVQHRRGDFMVAVVRRGDDHRLDAVIALRLGRQQVAPCAVPARLIDPQPPGHFETGLGRP